MNKTAVGKYFLEELVDETGKPRLAQKIEYPKAFWLELVSTFTNCMVLDQQKKILRTMILMYQVYFEVITDVQFMIT